MELKTLPLLSQVRPGSAVNLKGIWPRRAPAGHAAGGMGAFYLFVCLFIYLFLNLAEAAASMQFAALTWLLKLGAMNDNTRYVVRARKLTNALSYLRIGSLY